MVELKAMSPASGLVPLEIGQTRLTELDDAPVHMVTADGAGQAALAAQFGPLAEGAVAEAHGNVILPFAPGQHLVRGDVTWLADGPCHVTEQSDAWVWLVLEGVDAAAVLARLVAFDLDPARLAPGQVHRALLGHMNGLVWRSGQDQFILVAFRSMAASLVTELDHAMHAVAARAALRAPLP